MKKFNVIFLFLAGLFLSLIPNLVKANEVSKICKYTNERILAYINIYDDGTVKSEGYLVKDGVTSGKYHSERKIGNEYKDVGNCPKYLLATYGRDGADIAKYYVSNTKSELETIIKNKKFKTVDFATYDIYDAISGGFVVATIIELQTESDQNDDSTKKCAYNQEITNCDNCKIEIEFYKSGTSYDVGESVIKDYTYSGNLSAVNFVGDEWKKREFNTSLKQTTTPFQEFLGYNLCPEGLIFKYDKDSKKLDIYVNETAYNQNISGEGTPDPDVGTNPDQGTLQTGCEVIPEVVRKWINNILNFVKYIALALVIALGALDFMKAAASGEPDGMKKAGQSFIKRLIAVVVLFLLPVIVDFILNMVNIYGVDTNNIDCL